MELNTNNTKEIDKLVLKWQQTRDEKIAEQLFKIYKRYILGKTKKNHSVEDVKSVIHEAFMYCLNKYDPNVGTSFFQFFNFTVDYYIKNAYNGKKRITEIPVVIYKPENKGPRFTYAWESATPPLSLNHAYNQEDVRGKGILTDSIEANNSQEDFKNLEYEMILEKAKKEFNIKERDLLIIKYTLAGYQQTEIAKMLGLTQSRISSILRGFKSKKRYKGLYEFLKENFQK